LANAVDPMVFLVLREIHQRHRVQDERHGVILRQPVLPSRRKQEGPTVPGPVNIWCYA
jgi:hypothetical protein